MIDEPDPDELRRQRPWAATVVTATAALRAGASSFARSVANGDDSWFAGAAFQPETEIWSAP